MLHEKQERLNEVTNRWNNCKIKDTSLDPDILFIEIYNLNLKFKKIKEKYGNDEDELKAHVFDVVPEEYKQVRVSCNVNISNMEFKDLKKEICRLWKTKLNGTKTQEKEEPEEKVVVLNAIENKWRIKSKNMSQGCWLLGKINKR